MKINKYILYFICVCFAKFLLLLCYAYLLNISYPDHNDARNYYLGYDLIANQGLNIENVQRYFGRKPEFIFPIIYYFFSIFLNLSSVNEVIILNTFITFPIYALAIKKFISAVFKEQPIRFQMCIAILLIAILPIGVYVQLARQAFGFSLALLLVSLFMHRLQFLKLLAFPMVAITHVGSIFATLQIFYSKNLLLHIIHVLTVYYLLTSVLSLHQVSFSDITSFKVRDQYLYVVLAMFSVTLLLQFRYISKSKLAQFAILVFLYMFVSYHVAFSTRFLYGFSWFFLTLLLVSLATQSSKKKLSMITFNLFSLLLLTLNMWLVYDTSS